MNYDWVTARGECTSRGTLAILAEAIKHDVDRYNELPPRERGNYLYGIEPQGKSFTVECTTNQQQEVMAVAHADSVEITLVREGRRLIISQQWCEPDAECVLLLDRKPTCLLRIRQEILGELFFGWRRDD